MFEIPIRQVLGDKTIEIISNFLNCKIWLRKQTATTKRKRPHVIPLSLSGDNDMHRAYTNYERYCLWWLVQILQINCIYLFKNV